MQLHNLKDMLVFLEKFAFYCCTIVGYRKYRFKDLVDNILISPCT